MSVILCLILLPLLAITALLLTVSIYRDQRTRLRERTRIHIMQAKIQQALSGTPAVKFTDSLARTPVTTGLQLPSFSHQMRWHRQLPEKYRILQKLADQGMGELEIAETLDMSRVEAGQLLSLAAVGSTRQRCSHSGVQSNLRKKSAECANIYQRGYLPLSPD
ncbi:MAG: hypothetical protein CSA34_01220 [Desulfobulbus propionicus]|nr:MAG: hypothetical protein CSA34_01220 [Desulfobulbus propionicus]